MRPIYPPDAITLNTIVKFSSPFGPGLVQVVCGLPELVHLERGDFLCDVIDFCDENNLVKTFKIEDFFSSEEYYFHSEDQARIVQLI